ncbi:UNVERIFIED_CONTAM: hypothetical protein Slati_4478800 [Sesamum latifolium]|uniref:Endonuclease/exonuclease/phosphatase domain-containing protein n=1 Tax=Sesamum latifolium TaxID=2727402 RepID=A0AAW2SU88_9LAMI
MELQGLGGPWTVQGLGNLIRDCHPALVFVAETKCSANHIDRLKYRFDMNGVGVDARGKNGGLAFLWAKSVDVLLQSFSQNHIDVSIRLSEEQEWWRFTKIYGEPDAGKWELTWKLLARLQGQSSRPWLCAGDFNELLDQSEKLGGPPRPVWQIRNFRTALLDCGLYNLGYLGDIFTWSNKHPVPNTVLECLDRVCGNTSWSQLFPSGFVSHIPMSCSDHKAIHIHLTSKQKVSRGRSRPWRFEAAWLQADQCEGVLTKGWNWVMPGANSDDF